ncbi:MAG: hypothetical protein Dasosvirus6_7 [Dasosvirus sp.]|uniref:Uncharacterized protein n=1 Tax=Dasosvirus sp. TaxID=2487764 RepID=A0A3G4ZRP8_9VIRU|nr:MAG: hypothetical protein Dasosvirus6_7 [Dasosvirus sp.]
MCRDFESSVLAGTFSYLTALILYNRNIGYDRWLALIIFSFSSIQWAEAIIWKNLDNDINMTITSYLIPIILASEGLFSLIGASMYETVDPYMWVIYIVIFFAIILGWSKTSGSKVVDGNLSWRPVDWSANLAFAVYLIVPVYMYMHDELMKNTLIVFTLGSLAYAIINNSKSISSNWCYYANIASVIALSRPYVPL